jgi:hypothetical protein
MDKIDKINYLNHFQKKTNLSDLHYFLVLFVFLLGFFAELISFFLEHISEVALSLELEDFQYLIIHSVVVDHHIQS